MLKSKDKIRRTICDIRQNSLKWILVTSFGYLGFNNAKFGRFDAHIAVCAFDRQILLYAAKISERCGLGVLHGIVDSIWIQKKNKHEDVHNKTIDIKNYLKLKESIASKQVLSYLLKVYTSGLLLFIPKQMISYPFQTAILEHLKMVV